MTIDQPPRGNPLYDEVSPFPDGADYHIGGWRNVPNIIHDKDQVRGFFGPYRFLSNFKRAKVVLDGVEYTSVEKAYQAAKWKPKDRDFFRDCLSKEAIAYNRTHQPNAYEPDEWDDIKLEVMCSLLIQKFDPSLNPECARLLIQTGDRYLEETNWWGDVFWGKTLDGNGANNLGELLMAIREHLREEQAALSSSLG